MGKNLLFYAVSGTVIGLVAQWAGASLMVNLLASLLGPPFLLILILLARRRGMF